jgi:hypothetical protein
MPSNFSNEIKNVLSLWLNRENNQNIFAYDLARIASTV